MRQFFKIVFGSMIGFTLTILILTFFLVVSITRSSQKTKVTVAANSILKIDMAATLPDRATDNPLEMFSPMGLEVASSIGLFDMVTAIQHAKTDDKIKGIYITTDYLSESYASLDQLRRVLEDFKTSGKFIIAYNNLSSQKSYYISSVADSVFLHPQGFFEFDGMSIETRYYKKLLEKLEIEPIPLYAGDFKSASEPYRVEEMSDSNRVQLKALLVDLYDNYLETISKARGKSITELRNLADSLTIKDPQSALTAGLVDALGYDDEVEQAIRSKMGYEEDDDIKYVTLKDYTSTFVDKNKAKERIAVVYAEGTIVFGEGKSGQIGGEGYLKTIRKLRKDKKVKAIVLRINSGGGSAFASDQIWRELMLAKEEKPLVVSMGNYAASGGYYIAAMADEIYAEKNTITGSIGVVGMMFNLEKFFENKLGVTHDREKTSPYADFGNLNREWSATEIAAAEHQVKRIYLDFKQKVADGRGMTMEEVEKIAQGRVWTGQDAIEIGLVDKIGDLNDAIKKAAELANLQDYKLKDYPEQKDIYEQIMDMFSVKTDKAIQKELGVLYPYIDMIQQIEEWNGVQARMPFIMEVN
jgi:protease-4